MMRGWGVGRHPEKQSEQADTIGSDHFKGFQESTQKRAFLVQPDHINQGCGLKSLKPVLRCAASPLSELTSETSNNFLKGLHFSRV